MAEKKKNEPIVLVFVRGDDWFIDYIFFADNDDMIMEIEYDELTIDLLKFVRAQIEKQLDRLKDVFEEVES